MILAAFEINETGGQKSLMARAPTERSRQEALTWLLPPPGSAAWRRSAGAGAFDRPHRWKGLDWRLIRAPRPLQLTATCLTTHRAVATTGVVKVVGYRIL